MSQQQQQQTSNTTQKFTKTKEQRAKQKDNTNAWLKKQQQKKKKKQQEQQQKPVELDQKALQKAKRKQQKRLERQQMLKQQAQQNKKQETQPEVKPSQAQKQQTSKVEEKKSKQKVPEQKQPSNKDIKPQGKKNIKKGGETSTKGQQEQKDQIKEKLKDKIIVPSIPKPVFTELLTLENHLQKVLPEEVSKTNKPKKTQLIYKYLEQYINDSDTILILSNTDSWHPLAQNCGRRVFLYPMHEQYTKCQQCQNIVCTYEDVAYLMEGTLTKIFVQLDVVFANGKGLTQKGNENIIVLANEFKIPVIGFTGTWNFNAWNFLSIQTFLNKYGETYIQKYDILENDQFQIIVLEIGSVIPKQILGHLQNLSKNYRGIDIKSIKW